MERTITFLAGEDAAGQKLSQFLRKRGLSRQCLVRLKQAEDTVLVEGRPRHLDAKLSPGEEIILKIREEESTPHVQPVPLPLSILYEDEDILVVDKKAGMPVHPSSGNQDNTLANALAYYFKEQGRPYVFRCSNRLDRDTSGLLVTAKHYVSASILSEMGAARKLNREYLAITRGEPSPPFGTIDAPIGRLPGSIIRRTIDFEKGESAITTYRLVMTRNGHSLLWVKLGTGRTHQIRIHLQYLGCPLVGDYLYNPDMEYIGRQALHSFRLSFAHPITGEALSFTSPLPPDMARVLGEERELATPMLFQGDGPRKHT